MERGSNRVLSSSEYIGVSSSSASPLPTQHHLLTMSSSKPMAPPSLASFRPSLAGTLNPPFSVPDSSSTSSSLQSPSLQSASSPLIRLPADCSVSRPKTSTIPGVFHIPNNSNFKRCLVRPFLRWSVKNCKNNDNSSRFKKVYVNSQLFTIFYALGRL